MARRRKVDLVKGPKRVKRHPNGDLEIVRTLFCGECGRATQAATIQIGKARADREGLNRRVEVARVCDNREAHKDGKRYFWPVGETIIPRYGAGE